MENRNKTVKRQIIENVVWAYGERLIAQVISLAISVVLARLIEPKDFGVISIVMVLITLADVFVSAGFGCALVQKREIKKIDCDTAFVLGEIISIILYTLLFLLAPFIALFYSMPILTSVIRVMGIRLLIAAINSVQHAIVQRNMKFKKFFFSTLFGTVISGGIGIVLAYCGYSVWALVAQYLSNIVIDTIVLLIIGEWRPKLQFSIIKLREIFCFGWKVLVQRFINAITNNVQSLVIGKKFSAEELAFYNNGAQIPQVILTNVFDTIGKVAFPAIASIQDEEQQVKRVIRESIRLCTFLLTPVALGIAVVARPIVLVFLTDKWEACIPFLQIYCLRYLPRPHSTILQQALLAKGKSDIVLKIEIVLNVTLFSTLILAAFIFENLIMIAGGTLIAVFVGIICYGWGAKQVLGYTFKEQFCDYMPSFVSASIMAIIVYVEGYFHSTLSWSLFFQVVTGIIIYIIFSFLLNRKLIRKMIEMIVK